MVICFTMHASSKTLCTVLTITYYGTSHFTYLDIQLLKKDMCVVSTINSIVEILNTCNDTAHLDNDSPNIQTHHP